VVVVGFRCLADRHLVATINPSLIKKAVKSPNTQPQQPCPYQR
jgi:hypothetical protein